MLVRIDGSSTVHHVVGPALVPLTDSGQADLIAGPRWRDAVRDLTASEVRRRKLYVAARRPGAAGGPVETADRVQQGLDATGSTPLGLGRWSGPVVRWARQAMGADLTKYESP